MSVVPDLVKGQIATQGEAEGRGVQLPGVTDGSRVVDHWEQTASAYTHTCRHTL